MNILSPRSRRDGQTEKEHPSWNPFGQYKGGSAHSPRRRQHSQAMGTWAAALGEKVSAEVLRVFCQRIICTLMELGEGKVCGSGSPARLWSAVSFIKFLRQQYQAESQEKEAGWAGRLSRWPRHGVASAAVRERLLPQRQSCVLMKCCGPRRRL